MGLKQETVESVEFHSMNCGLATTMTEFLKNKYMKKIEKYPISPSSCA